MKRGCSTCLEERDSLFRKLVKLSKNSKVCDEDLLFHIFAT